MAFWKSKDKPLIPPVAEPPVADYRGNNYAAGGGSSSSSPHPSVRTNSSTYVANNFNRSNSTGQSNGGHSAPDRDRYNRNNPVGDKYSRGQGEVEQDRNELFSGYSAEKAGARSRFFDGPAPRKEPVPGEEDDEDVEGIKQQTKYIKQESVNSTRNALRLAREAEETARNTLGRLGDQSGMYLYFSSVIHREINSIMQKNWRTLNVIWMFPRATPFVRTTRLTNSKNLTDPFSVLPLHSTKMPKELLRKPNWQSAMKLNAKNARRLWVILERHRIV